MSDPVPDMIPDPDETRLEAELRELGAAYRRVSAPPLSLPWDRPQRAESSAPRPRWTGWSFLPAGAALAATLLLAITARFVLRPTAAPPVALVAPRDAEQTDWLIEDDEAWMEDEGAVDERDAYASTVDGDEALEEDDEDWPLVPSPFAADLRGGDSLGLSISPFSSEFRGLGGLRMSLIDEETEDLPEEQEI